LKALPNENNIKTVFQHKYKCQSHARASRATVSQVRGGPVLRNRLWRHVKKDLAN